jgi:hypothetical protein
MTACLPACQHPRCEGCISVTTNAAAAEQATSSHSTNLTCYLLILSHLSSPTSADINSYCYILKPKDMDDEENDDDDDEDDEDDDDGRLLTWLVELRM